MSALADHQRGLAIDDVSVRYDATLAVDGVSLRVEPGEILALIGPSGCGKSSLLRAVAGLKVPDSGRIAWDGDDLTSIPPERRDFGLMFQDHALFPHRNVADNVSFGLEMKRLDRQDRDQRTEAMLRLVNLDGFGGRRIDSLSGGEAQRVALARALAPSPRLLMLDEPLGSLDRALRDRLAVDIRSVLNEVEQSAILVTHDQDEAFAIADRVAVMRSGRIVRIGSPVEIWSDPQYEFIATFLGHPNIVDGAAFGGPSGRAVIRTESLLPVEPGETASIEGVVTTQQFRGDHFRIVFVTSAGIELIAMSRTKVDIGDSVHYNLNPADLATIAPDSATLKT